MELVTGTLAYVLYEAAPDAGTTMRLERSGLLVPAVEVADDRDVFGVRCPNGEARARSAVTLFEVRPEPCGQIQVAAFVE